MAGRLRKKETKNHYSAGLSATTTRTQRVCAVWRVARPRRSTPSAAPMSTTETGGGGDGGVGVDDDGSDCGGSGSSGVPPVDNRVRFSVRSRSIASRTGRRARTPSLPFSLARASPPPPPPQPPPIQLCVVSTAVPSVCVAPPVPTATEQAYNK